MRLLLSEKSHKAGKCQTEQKIRGGHEHVHLNDIIESLSDGVIVLDENLEIFKCNDKALAFFQVQNKSDLRLQLQNEEFRKVRVLHATIDELCEQNHTQSVKLNLGNNFNINNSGSNLNNCNNYGI